MKLKGLHFTDVFEIQEAITDELKKVQKVEFSAAFQKLRLRKELYIYIYMEIELILKKSFFLICLRLKKVSLKALDCTMYAIQFNIKNSEVKLKSDITYNSSPASY
jgi:hypothetical protein